VHIGWQQQIFGTSCAPPRGNGPRGNRRIKATPVFREHEQRLTIVPNTLFCVRYVLESTYNARSQPIPYVTCYWYWYIDPDTTEQQQNVNSSTLTCTQCSRRSAACPANESTRKDPRAEEQKMPMCKKRRLGR